VKRRASNPITEDWFDRTPTYTGMMRWLHIWELEALNNLPLSECTYLPFSRDKFISQSDMMLLLEAHDKDLSRHSRMFRKVKWLAFGGIFTIVTALICFVLPWLWVLTIPGIIVGAGTIVLSGAWIVCMVQDGLFPVPTLTREMFLRRPSLANAINVLAQADKKIVEAGLRRNHQSLIDETVAKLQAENKAMRAHIEIIEHGTGRRYIVPDHDPRLDSDDFWERQQPRMEAEMRAQNKRLSTSSTGPR
jgi:hypothetical protein